MSDDYDPYADPDSHLYDPYSDPQSALYDPDLNPENWDPPPDDYNPYDDPESDLYDPDREDFSPEVSEDCYEEEVEPGKCVKFCPRIVLWPTGEIQIEADTEPEPTECDESSLVS